MPLAILFTINAIAISWLCWLPLVASNRQLGHVAASTAPLLIVLGTFGPFFSAVTIVARTSGFRGLGAFLGQVFHWRVGIQWYLVALVAPPAIRIVVLLVHVLKGGSVPDLSDPARTPNLVYVTPNECNDGHTNCVNGHPPVPVIPGEAFTPYDTYFELQQEDAFLKQVVPRILAAPAYKQNGLLVITYDESDSDLSACCNEQPGPADPNPGGVAGIPVGPGGGQTGTVLLSPCIKPGSSTTGEYNHYSLLRSIEDLFGLTHLGYAGQQGLVPFGDDVYNAPRPGPGCAPRPAPSGGGTGGTGGGGGGQQGGGGGGGQGGGQTSGGCKTLRGPHSSFTTHGVRYDRRRIVLVGRSSERGCDGRPVAIRVVQLAVARVVGGRCRFLSAMGEPGPRRACTRRFYVLARGGGRGFGLRIPGPLAPGGYVARIRAVDVEGRPEDRLAQGHVLHFTIR